MGIEAFGVTIRFVKSGVYYELRTTLLKNPHIRMESEESIGGYNTISCEYFDGSHFIDFLLSSEIASAKCVLSVRFSLSSYESIDNIFIDIIKDMLSLHEADVWLMVSALHCKNNYFPSESNWLFTALPDEIIAMRKYWQNLFGIKQGAVRVKDSFSFIGVIDKS